MACAALELRQQQLAPLDIAAGHALDLRFVLAAAREGHGQRAGQQGSGYSTSNSFAHVLFLQKPEESL
jgi:hypothetical protein